MRMRPVRILEKGDFTESAKTETKVYTFDKKVYVVRRFFIGNVSFEELVKKLILKEINTQ